MDTSTLEKHQKYTRDEFVGNSYYQEVIDTLRDSEIETMIDIGGCTGEVTKVMFENVPTLKKSYIIEPIPENADFIRKNLENYNVTVYERALYYGKDEIRIGFTGNNVGSGTVFIEKDIQGVTCKTITLEDLPLVDFVKVDIEGLEAHLIENSTNIKKIPFIEIEFHHYDEQLQHEQNRIPYIKKWLPHRVICGGKGSDKESSLFLAL